MRNTIQEYEESVLLVAWITLLAVALIVAVVGISLSKR
jgi:hypothetical protein